MQVLMIDDKRTCLFCQFRS